MTKATDQPQPDNASERTPEPAEASSPAPLDKQIDDILAKAMNTYKLYICGPVPAEFLTGDPNVEPHDIIKDRAALDITALLAKAEKKGRLDELKQVNNASEKHLSIDGRTMRQAHIDDRLATLESGTGEKA